MSKHERLPSSAHRSKGAQPLVGVLAHNGKTLGGGLDELRQVLAREGQAAPLWREVSSSRAAPKAAHKLVKAGARLLFVWGGDGMVQRCVDALAGEDGVELAIVPAGTANLLAHNLGIPQDIAQAVAIGLRGEARRLDVGAANGERFAVMAGVGFDGRMIGDVTPAEKRRVGRLAYFRSAFGAMRAPRVPTRVEVDGERWFDGEASAVLVGNVGTVTGGLEVFPEASPADGVLDVGVVTASGIRQWLGVFGRVAAKALPRSPHVLRARGRKIDVSVEHKAPHELDGGARDPRKRFKFRVEPGAIVVRVPRAISPRTPRARARRGTAGNQRAPRAAAGSAARRRAG